LAIGSSSVVYIIHKGIISLVLCIYVLKDEYVNVWFGVKVWRLSLYCQCREYDSFVYEPSMYNENIFWENWSLWNEKKK